ncbi:transposase [Streptomyces umbrinus]
MGDKTAGEFEERFVDVGPWITDDDLWALIEPLPPPWPEKSPGPRPAADRLCRQGIQHVLHNDVAWQILPLELRFGSGQTCRRRPDHRQQAGVFDHPGQGVHHGPAVTQSSPSSEMFIGAADFCKPLHRRAQLRVVARPLPESLQP